MNDGHCVGTVNGDFSWSGSNDIGLVLLVELLGFLVVLVVRQHTGEDAVKFGESGGERSRDLCRDE